LIKLADLEFKLDKGGGGRGGSVAGAEIEVQ